MYRTNAFPVFVILVFATSCMASVADDNILAATSEQGATVSENLSKLPANMRLVLEEFDGVHPAGRWDAHYHEGSKESFDYEVRRDALIMVDKVNRNQHITRRGFLLDPKSQYAVEAFFIVKRARRMPNSFCLNFSIAGDDGVYGPISCWAVNVSVQPRQGRDRGGVSFNMGFLDGKFRRVGDAAQQDWSKFDTEYTMRVEVNTDASGGYKLGCVRVSVWQGDELIHRRQADYTQHPYQPDLAKPVRIGVNSHGGNWTMRNFKVYSVRKPVRGGQWPPLSGESAKDNLGPVDALWLTGAAPRSSCWGRALHLPAITTPPSAGLRRYQPSSARPAIASRMAGSLVAGSITAMASSY